GKRVSPNAKRGVRLGQEIVRESLVALGYRPGPSRTLDLESIPKEAASGIWTEVPSRSKEPRAQAGSSRYRLVAILSRLILGVQQSPSRASAATASSSAQASTVSATR